MPADLLPAYDTIPISRPKADQEVINHVWYDLVTLGKAGSLIRVGTAFMGVDRETLLYDRTVIHAVRQRLGSLGISTKIFRDTEFDKAGTKRVYLYATRYVKPAQVAI